MNKEETIEYLKSKDINHWGIAYEYASKIHPYAIVGVSTPEDHEQMVIIKTAFEEGMLEATKLLTKDNKQ